MDRAGADFYKVLSTTYQDDIAKLDGKKKKATIMIAQLKKDNRMLEEKFNKLMSEELRGRS